MKKLIIGMTLLSSVSAFAGDACILKVSPSKFTQDARVLNDIAQKGYQVQFTNEHPNLVVEEYDRGTMLANKRGIYWADINCLALLMDDRGENVKMILKKIHFSPSRSAVCLKKALKVVVALPFCNQ